LTSSTFASSGLTSVLTRRILSTNGFQFSMVFGRFAPVSFESLYALQHTSKPNYGLFAVFEGPRHVMCGEPFAELCV
jgi:hypothetical protein